MALLELESNEARYGEVRALHGVSLTVPEGRMVAVLGKNRGDLAQEFSAADFDGVVDVTVDPSTMIPKPQALKQWELDNAYDREIISKDEWRERSLFGNVRDIQTPNDVQYAKAKRVAEQIKLGQPQEPVVWQDDEAIHQNVLDRDLILAGGTDPKVTTIAQQRWQQLAEQAQQKQGPQPPKPGSPEANYAKFIQTVVNDSVAAAEKLLAQVVDVQLGIAAPAPPPGALQNGPPGKEGNGKAPPKGHPMDPRTAPLIGGSPSVAAGPAAAQGGPGVSRQEQATAQFEGSHAL